MRMVKRFVAIAAAAALTLSAGVGATASAYDTAVDIAIFENVQKQEVHSSFEDAAADLRDHLRNRQENFAVTVEYGLVTTKEDINSIMNQAITETSSPKEGDYIRFNLQSISYSTSNSTISNGMNINFNIRYNASYAEEAKVDQAISELSDSLGLPHLNDYEKCCAVTQWVRSNVTYVENSTERSLFSAYGALIDRQAVCQGISVLVYRLLRENNVKCRVVPGKGNGGNHAWNMVCIDGNWVYLDATWDALTGRSDYIFFLRGSRDFDSLSVGNYHDVTDFGGGDSPLYMEYNDGSFAKNYPVQPYHYATSEPGDLDGDGIVTASDASMVLHAYSRLATTGNSGLTSTQSQAGDIYRRCSVDSSCASGILAYYSYLSTGGTLSLEEFINS